MQTVALPPPSLKAAFGSASVAWNGESGVSRHTGRRTLTQRRQRGRGRALIAMLQVQMAHCFMCGLNGVCQPSYWRPIIWRDHTKTLSTKIQRFINKGHFHDSKCLLDGQDSRSHHGDKRRLNAETLNEDRIILLQPPHITKGLPSELRSIHAGFCCQRFFCERFN